MIYFEGNLIIIHLVNNSLIEIEFDLYVILSKRIVTSFELKYRII